MFHMIIHDNNKKKEGKAIQTLEHPKLVLAQNLHKMLNSKSKFTHILLILVEQGQDWQRTVPKRTKLVLFTYL